MYAHDYTWNLALMGKIASIFVGEPVTVEFHDTNRWMGEAVYQDGLKVRISWNQPTSEVATTFFHEIGHMAVGHTPRHNREHTGMDLADVGQALHENPDDKWAADMKVFLEKREEEVEAWRKVKQAWFESKYDFLKVMTIR